MEWIKRNLLFVIGAVVALGLLGFAGFYNYSGWKHNTDARNERIKAYEELKRLSELPIQPGSGKVDNIQTARDQAKAIRAVLVQAAKHFQSPPPVPAKTNVTSGEFAAALRRTIDQLTHDAADVSVLLPPDYKFSFSQQFRQLTFAPGSLDPLAVQLGEVKALSDILIQAKVNYIDSIQRERVSPDDANGPSTDYVGLPSQTNELAVMTPYLITFRSFSPEIAQVLAGFANSPYGIISQAIRVEPAATAGSEQPGAPTAAMPYAPSPIAPASANPAAWSRPGEEALARAGMRPPPPDFAPSTAYTPPAYTPPAYAAPAVARSGPQTVLNEKPLRITMLVQVVKLLPTP